MEIAIQKINNKLDKIKRRDDEQQLLLWQSWKSNINYSLEFDREKFFFVLNVKIRNTHNLTVKIFAHFVCTNIIFSDCVPIIRCSTSSSSFVEVKGNGNLAILLCIYHS